MNYLIGSKVKCIDQVKNTIRNRDLKGQMNKSLKKEEESVIVNMNDLKSILREWVVNKMEEDFEKMVRKYIKQKIIKQSMDNKLLRKIDVCEMLGVSIGKVDLMMEDGLKYIKLNRNVRFRLEDVNEYLNNKIVV